MKKAFKIFVLVFLLASQIVFAQSDSEKADALYNQGTILAQQGKYKESIELLEKSFHYEPKGDVAFNLGIIYKRLKNYKIALKWFKKAFKMGYIKGGVSIGFIYDDIYKDYSNAIKWYKKAFEMGYTVGAKDLGLLYEEIDKDYPNAITWYKKAIKKGNISARKNLGLLYHDQHNNLNSAIYMMGMIGHPYTRERIIGILRNNWKIDEKTLLKAYTLQKKLIPNPYLDPEFEAQIPAPQKSKRGRR